MATSLHSLDKDRIDELYKKGAFLIIKDMPTGTEFGVDYASWTVGPKFMGLKMVPPGVHFIFYSAVSKQGTVAPRSGFFYTFTEGEVLCKDWNAAEECLKSSADPVHDPRSVDTNLAAYPFQHYQRWCSLSSHVTSASLARVQPPNIIIHSATALLPNPNAAEDTKSAVTVEQKLDANFIADTQNSLRFAKLDRKGASKGRTGADLSSFFMDTTDTVEWLVGECGGEAEVLAELQISFLVFLLGHVYSAFDQWKQIVDTLCRARAALKSRPEFYKSFIRILHYHLKETPSDFFVDIVSRDNFLVSCLGEFFRTLGDEGEGLEEGLVSRGKKFRSHLEKHFDWEFLDCEDDLPVVVELPA